MNRVDVALSDLEAWLSAHEGRVRHDLAHSGVEPLLDYGPLPAEPDLLAALARHLGVPQEEVVVANGAGEAAFLAAVAVLAPGDTVAVESPTFPPLAQGPALLGARVARFPRAFADAFAAPAAPVGGAALTTFTSPHNPSGRRVPPEVIRATAEATGGYVLVDEIFREISEEPWPTARRAHPRALAVGSLTKAQGLPGVRVGWLLAPPDVAERARAAKNILSTSAGLLDQRLAQRALANPALAARAVARRRENLPRVQKAVESAGLEWVRPEAGLSCVVRVEDDQRVAERLLARGVLVVPGSALGLAGTLRLGFGGPPEAVAQALDAFVASVR